MKKVLSIFLMLLCISINADAYDFMVDGLCYNKNYGNSVTLTYIGIATSYTDIDSNLIIPDSVSYEGITYYVTAIDGNTFWNCTTLESVIVGNYVTSLGEYTFVGCSNLKSIYLPPSVSYISDFCFYDCSSLEEIVIPEAVTYIPRYAFFNCTSLNKVQMGNSVETIDKYAFMECHSLSSISIGNTVKTIGQSAFENCQNLRIVDFGENVTNVGSEAFYHCENIDTVFIHNITKWCGITFKAWNANPLYYTKTLYVNGENAKKLIIPEPVTTINSYAFYGCKGIQSLDLKNTVKTIGYYAFSGCSNIRFINFGNGVKTISQGAFANCNNISSLYFPNNIETIEKSGFYKCSNLTKLYLGEVKYIADDCFNQSKLKSLIIPKSVKNIGTYAFFNNYTQYSNSWDEMVFCGDTCDNFSSVTRINNIYFKDNVKSIKGLNIEKANHIYCFGSIPPECNENTFKSYSATLHVPEGSLVNYFADQYWGNFENIITDAIAAEYIHLNTDTLNLDLGNSIQLNCEVSPQPSGLGVTWMSTNPNVATVNSYGYITAKSIGETDIIVQWADIESRCHVIVDEAPIIISLDTHELLLKKNEIKNIVPSYTPPTTSINYVIDNSDSSVAFAKYINGKIQVLGIKPGETIVTVSSEDGVAIPDSCKIIVLSDYDVDNDGNVTAADITAIYNYLLNGDETYLNSSDVDGDGAITAADITEIYNVLLGN